MLVSESVLPTVLVIFVFVYVALALVRLTLMTKNWRHAKAYQVKSDELQRRYEARAHRAEEDAERWTRLLDRAEALIERYEKRSNL